MIVKCSNCNKKLIEVDDVALTSKKVEYQASCCYCGDNSFKFQAHEGVRMSGVGIEKEDEYAFYEEGQDHAMYTSPRFVYATMIVNMKRMGEDSWLIITKKI